MTGDRNPRHHHIFTVAALQLKTEAAAIFAKIRMIELAKAIRRAAADAMSSGADPEFIATFSSREQSCSRRFFL
jgi:hypothetical protein